MRLLAILAIFSALLLVAAHNAEAAKTERTIAVKIQNSETKFVVKTYDFERKISVDVSDAMLKKIKNAFGTDTFVFYNQVSKKQNGQDYISIAPKIHVGQKLQVKFM